MSFHIYPIPVEEPVSEAFDCSIEGQPVPVRLCRVSAMPFNRRWPGHQRQFDQSEEGYFVSFSMDGPVTVRVRPNRPFRQAVIRPLSKQVALQEEEGVLTFTLPSPGGYSLELDGYHHNLHVFADPPAQYDIHPDDPQTLYFGPGIHEIGVLELTSGQTVVLDEGAVVYGCLHATDCENIRILGRGVLDNAKNCETLLYEVEQLGDGSFDVRNAKREHTIQLIRCRNVTLDGLTIRDSLVYNVGLWGCDEVEIRGLKIIGCWRYNSDGIDFHNCRRCHVEGCFIRTFDDTVCFKGHMGYQQVCEDILVENCVVWCDWDHCLEFGAECCAERMRRLVFRNIDVIRSLDTALNIGNVDYGTVSDVTFEDIRVELDPVYQRPQMQGSDEQSFVTDPHSGWLPLLMSCFISWHPEYSEGRTERGHIRDVLFRNIQVFGERMPPSRFVGYDDQHRVERVAIDGLYWNGRRLTDPAEANITVGEYTAEITLL